MSSPRLCQCRVAALDLETNAFGLGEGELVEDVRALEPWSGIDEEQLQDCDSLLTAARHAVKPGRPEALRSLERGISGVSSAASSQSSAAAPCPTCGRVLGGRLQLGGDSSVGAVCGERQMAGALFGVRHNLRERRCTAWRFQTGAARNRSRRAAGARSERRGVVELDHSFVGARLECGDDALAISVRVRDQIDRRSSERGDLEQDIEGLAGQPGEGGRRAAPATSRARQGPAGGRARVRAYQLAAQLQREEGIARRRLLHPGELGSRQLEPEPLLEQAVHGGQTERAERTARAARPGTRAPARTGSPSSGAFRTVAGRPDRLALKTSKRDLQHSGRGRVEPLASSSATRTGSRSDRARKASSTASPIACGSGGISPGSTSSSATSSARRRGGASEGPTSSST